MLKSSLIEILKKFTKEDLSKFEDFVKSPFHNKKSNVTKLFSNIKKFAPDLADQKLLKEDVWKKIFPGKPYNYGVMKNLIHDLTKLTESYLVQQNLRHNFNSEKHLIDELFRMKAYDVFNDRLQKFEKKIDSVKTETELYYKNRLFYYDMYGKYRYSNSYNDSHIKDELKCKIFDFMLSIFRSAYGLFEESTSIKGAGEFEFAVHVLKYFEIHQVEFADDAVMKLYYYVLLCLLETDEAENYPKLIKLFNENKKGLARADRRNISDCICLYYELKHREGKSTYKKELLELYMEMVNEDVHSVNENDYVNLFIFRNIILSLNRTKSHERLEKFLQENINKVHPLNRAALLNFSMVSLSMMNKDYVKALNHCNRIDFNELFEDSADNIYFKDDLRYYSVKASYELEYFEEVLSQIDSYKHFLRSSKLIPDGLREPRIYFLSLIGELVLLHTRYDEQKHSKLLEKIMAFPFENPWLTRKSAELEKKNNVLLAKAQTNI